MGGPDSIYMAVASVRCWSGPDALDVRTPAGKPFSDFPDVCYLNCAGHLGHGK